ncbi:MAG: MvaI/BcnI family restriction endonuclease [Candidatus Bathyarchaeota archaeon]|nr:MvaI/BcnI family restriction endonuclease [Candidatus Bathyarchaeota archaeon]
MDYGEFVERIKQIKERGFVESCRSGDTGIGKTLEDLLGIAENNIAGPDFGVYELKSGRKDSLSMLTLFTKAPMPKGANKSLLEAFGYKQRVKKNQKQRNVTDYIDAEIREQECNIREKELHVTVDSKSVNSVGLRLEIKNKRIYISNTKNVLAYYDEAVLREAFEKKYKKLILVLASSKKEQGKEWFWFNEAYLLEGFSFDRFAELVKEGTIKLDLRIGHYPDGRPHDHGTGFRVLPKDRPKCFEKIVRLI